MKRINIIYSLILSVLLFISINAQQDCKSTITVTTNDSSAVIYLNGKFSGTGNATLDVNNGGYKVSVKSSARTWSADVLQDSVLIDTCGINRNLSFAFKKSIYLSTNPPDVDVFWGDSLLGNTPLYISPDIQTVELKKKDYRTEIIKPLQLNNSVFHMDFIGKKNGESFFKTNLFKIMVGSAIVLGGTAAYFKLKANDYYDNYNQTGDQSALDMTNRYDTISGIAFGALQVNFGFILYHLLTDN